MKTERKEILKIHEVSSTKKSADLDGCVAKIKEIVKSIIVSSEIPKAAIVAVIAALITASAIFFLLIVGNFTYGLSQPIYQLSGLAGNFDVTVDYHRQAILTDYLKMMTQVISEENSKQIKDKSPIFRAMTQTTLQELDSKRKRYIIMFLQDTGLLQISSRKQPSLLLGANLVGANLQGISLRSANLQGTNLAGADLRGTDLRDVNFTNANLNKSCYNSLTIFDKEFQPSAVGMREVTKSQECAWNTSR
ncbi:pentapeptide repeat-containing protein [Nostoc sp. UHCC 0302]|uniref:pentapeptide repeat-containing protein n=1 Tax=Nostoc sp. UHCC 0302 TaxID=3134896 RepID=UPI00311CA102